MLEYNLFVIYNKCEIINLTDKPVNITVIKDTANENVNQEENEDEINTNTAYINMNYTLDKQGQIFALMSSSTYDYIATNRDDSKLTITDLPSYVDSVSIVIYATNPENITGTNCNITNM